MEFNQISIHSSPPDTDRKSRKYSNGSWTVLVSSSFSFCCSLLEQVAIVCPPSPLSGCLSSRLRPWRTAEETCRGYSRCRHRWLYPAERKMEAKNQCWTYTFSWKWVLDHAHWSKALELQENKPKWCFNQIFMMLLPFGSFYTTIEIRWTTFTNQKGCFITILLYKIISCITWSSYCNIKQTKATRKGWF